MPTPSGQQSTRRLVGTQWRGYRLAMILIRFPNIDSKRAALAQLGGRFSFKSWASGEMYVPEKALPYLAVPGISFTVEGPAT
jgi:hypothetical protein